MSGFTDVTKLQSGFAEHFGGPQAMQEFIREKMGHLVLRIEAELKELKPEKTELAERLRSFRDQVKLVVVKDLITEEDLSRVTSSMPSMDLAEGFFYRDFFRLVVPEGKTEGEVRLEIQELLRPDPVAYTNFGDLVATIKACLEMQEALTVSEQ